MRRLGAHLTGETTEWAATVHNVRISACPDDAFQRRYQFGSSTVLGTGNQEAGRKAPALINGITGVVRHPAHHSYGLDGRRSNTGMSYSLANRSSRGIEIARSPNSPRS